MSAKVLPQKIRGQSLAVLGEHDRLCLRPRIDNPPFLVEQVHEIPVQPLPDPATIVKRQGEDGQRCLGESIAVDPVGEVTRWHDGGSVDRLTVGIVGAMAITRAVGGMPCWAD